MTENVLFSPHFSQLILYIHKDEITLLLLLRHWLVVKSSVLLLRSLLFLLLILCDPLFFSFGIFYDLNLCFSEPHFFWLSVENFTDVTDGSRALISSSSLGGLGWKQ
jgi:hypothetical protein